MADETPSCRGYTVEVTEKPIGGGGVFRTTTLLTPQQLLQQEVHRLISEYPGDPPSDRRPILLQAMINLTREALSQGHHEAAAWFVQYAPEIVGGPAALQLEGIYDALSAQAACDIATVQKAARAAVRRVGVHEWDGSSKAADPGWSREAKSIARSARRKQAARRISLEVAVEPRTPSGPAGTIFDTDGLAAELNLNLDERDFLRHYKVVPRNQLAGYLTAATGRSWDHKRVERTRKRIERHWPQIAAAARKQLTSCVGGQSNSDILNNSH